MSSSGRIDSGDLTRAKVFPPEHEAYCPSCDASFPADAKHCPTDGTKLVRLREVKDPLVGVNIDGRFRIKERIGTGGMGAVYLALQGSVGREVAIKVIEARLSAGKVEAKRFFREAKLASRLQQANIVTVLDFGQTEDGLLYLVMELVKGRTLGDVLTGEGPFSAARVVKVGVQLCDALEAAHRLSIIHRDLKPSNVILLDEPAGRDHIKVLDFGLAKSLLGETGSTTVTQSDAIMGTPSYIPPEAVTTMQFDERSDLYSLGVILYELASGQLPFDGTTVQTMLRQHAYERPRPLPPEVPAELQRILFRLLEKDPNARFPSAIELRDALQGLHTLPMTGQQLALSRAPIVRRPTRGAELTDTHLSQPGYAGPARRRVWPWLAGLALVGAATTAIVAVQQGGGGAPATTAAAPAPGTVGVAPAGRPGPLASGGGVSPPGAPTIERPVAGEIDHPTPAVAPTPSTVSLDLRAQPPAAVSVGGKPLGVTPQHYELARSTEPIDVGFTRKGFQAVTVQIIPTEDRTLVRELVPLDRVAHGGKVTGHKPPDHHPPTGDDGTTTTTRVKPPPIWVKSGGK